MTDVLSRGKLFGLTAAGEFKLGRHTRIDVERADRPNKHFLNACVPLELTAVLAGLVVHRYCDGTSVVNVMPTTMRVLRVYQSSPAQLVFTFADQHQLRDRAAALRGNNFENLRNTFTFPEFDNALVRATRLHRYEVLFNALHLLARAVVTGSCNFAGIHLSTFQLNFDVRTSLDQADSSLEQAGLIDAITIYHRFDDVNRSTRCALRIDMKCAILGAILWRVQCPVPKRSD